MLSFFEEYDSVPAKTCKKNPLYSTRLLEQYCLFLIIYELKFIHNTYVPYWYK